MATVQLWTHGPDGGSDPFSKLIKACGDEPVNLINGGFAFVTVSGVRRLRAAFDSKQSFQQSKKVLVAGIFHGITEPKALSLLKELPNAELYLFLPSQKMDKEALFSRPVYHPKFIEIRTGGYDCWMIGSANLTGSAVSTSGTNVEIASVTTVSGPSRTRARRDARNWRELLSKYLRPASKALINRYAKVRLKAVTEHPILLQGTEPGRSLEEAEELFLEVGAGSGRDRHQVEMNELLATFFGPLNPERKDFRFTRGGQIWEGRPLTPKVTTLDVKIYRLGMPTIRVGAEPIANRVIRFIRTAQADTFEYEVADVGSPVHATWISNANSQGHLGATSGGRKYGYIY